MDTSSMSTVASKDGTSIAFDQSGEGLTVILVGGALDTGQRSHPMFSQLAALLGEYFTVFAYDRRARGDSGDTLPYAVEREIEDIDALIAEAGGSAFVYGFSSGAALALRAAANLRVTKIKKLVLYEPPFSLGDEAEQDFARYTKQIDKLLEANKFGDAVALFLADMMPAEMLTAMRRSPEWPILETLAPTLAYDNAVMGNSLVPVDTAKAATMPTLVLNGAATFDFMKEAAHALAEAIPHASRKTLAGQDHGVAPEDLAPVLVDFFRRDRT